MGWAAHRLLSSPVTIRRTLAAVVVLPSAWVLAEAVRSWPSLGGPWALLGASQWNQPAMLASASLGGVWLTSFVIVAVNAAIAGMLLHRDARGRVTALAAALCAIGPAWFVMGPAPPGGGSTVRVALVQPGNIDDAAARLAAGEAITATLAESRSIWSSGARAASVDLGSHPDVMARLTDLSRRVGADLLVNADARVPSGGIYKSSVLIGPDGSLGSYQKVRLVPFGEYVPLRPLLGWATRHTNAAAEDRRRGGGQVVLHAGPIAIGPLISFETTSPTSPPRGAAWRSAAGVSEFHLDVPGSWAQPQLASQAAVHAVEVGHPAVHAGLSGVSAAFDARGRNSPGTPRRIGA